MDDARRRLLYCFSMGLMGAMPEPRWIPPLWGIKPEAPRLSARPRSDATDLALKEMLASAEQHLPK